ncbi:MAG: pirin family protein [Reyranellaceae bacterium]
MSVRFVLRDAERGLTVLPSTGAYASYVSGHPEGVITRRSSFNFGDWQSGIAGFGPLKVFGEETFTPGGTGYTMHPHHNFIILALVLAGTLTHVNTLGAVEQLRAGDYYAFAAGSGGKHSELNIGVEDTAILYVWLLPAHLLGPPSYRKGRFEAAACRNRLTPLIGAAAGALPVDQDCALWRLTSDRGRHHEYRPAPGRGVYAFVLEGEVELAGTVLRRRDSLALVDESIVPVVACTEADLLLFETAISGF